MLGTLYVVATPIGNLEDITLRAIRILREVSFIACEDTRQSIKLLNHFGIEKKLVSFHSHNQTSRVKQILSELKSGGSVALVSDSGTPAISDPGYLLIKEASEEKINVVALPGACAAICALSSSGLPTDGFVFLGFLKLKAGKAKKELLAAASLGHTIVFYESPHRILKTLAMCAEIFPSESKIVLARELTKKFEEIIRGNLADVSKSCQSVEPRGEYTILINTSQKQRKNEEG
ncbi:MAG: 16S rRNA (cytidine(1402)-2'-O)-methyltransferase [Endomicrobiales bacterium]|nr:16S rRNA (cytidine(1402)-2'-O)-methyltransferase [Endomicrobiales bacterium]